LSDKPPLGQAGENAMRGTFGEIKPACDVFQPEALCSLAQEVHDVKSLDDRAVDSWHWLIFHFVEEEFHFYFNTNFSSCQVPEGRLSFEVEK
jgi:hypothetical protein